jgi:hypothetical protein
MMAVVALFLDLCITEAMALNKMISKHSSFTKSQITRLLVKLECFEIILFNALAFFIHKSKIIATTAIIQFFQKTCDLNSGDGCSFLGLMYGKGKGVKQNDFMAESVNINTLDEAAEDMPIVQTTTKQSLNMPHFLMLSVLGVAVLLLLPIVWLIILMIGRMPITLS